MYTNEFYKIMATANEIGMNSTFLSAEWEQMEEDGWTHRAIVQMMWKKVELKQY